MRAKSSPTASRGRCAAWASAYEQQSRMLRAAGWRPLPNRRQASPATVAWSAVNAEISTPSASSRSLQLCLPLGAEPRLRHDGRFNQAAGGQQRIVRLGQRDEHGIALWLREQRGEQSGSVGDEAAHGRPRSSYPRISSADRRSRIGRASTRRSTAAGKRELVGGTAPAFHARQPLLECSPDRRGQRLARLARQLSGEAFCLLVLDGDAHVSILPLTDDSRTPGHGPRALSAPTLAFVVPG